MGIQMQTTELRLGPYEVGEGTETEVKKPITTRFSGGSAPWNRDALSREKKRVASGLSRLRSDT